MSKQIHERSEHSAASLAAMRSEERAAALAAAGDAGTRRAGGGGVHVSGRKRIPSAAQQAQAAAALGDDVDVEDVAEPLKTPQAAAEQDFDAALAEFQELARSAGAVEAAVLIQRRPKPDPATLVGGGKLDEIVGVVASTGASLVLFDHDLTPSQAAQH